MPIASHASYLAGEEAQLTREEELSDSPARHFDSPDSMFHFPNFSNWVVQPQQI